MKKRLFFGMLLIVCIVFVSFVFSQFYPGGMIAYWKFDEAEGVIAYDSVGDNHGILINGPTRTNGLVGGALSFDGFNDFVEIPAMSIDFSQMSLEGWIYVRQNKTQKVFRGELSHACFGIHRGYWERCQSAFGSPIILNSWHHVAIVDGVGVYIDGVLEIPSTMGGLTPTEILYIGGPPYHEYFNGLIDEVAIYDRTLTPTEILQHYVNGLNGMGYEVECIPPPTDMVSWWPGDGNAEDIVGENHGMEMSGATFADGMVDQTFSLDGVNDYIFVGDPMNLKISEDITIDSWIYPQEIGEGQVSTILSKWPQTVSTDSYVISIKKIGGVIKIIGGIGDGNTPDHGLIGGKIPSNTWSHVAMTYDSLTGTNKLYKNGYEVASRYRPNGIHISESPVLIGAFKNLYATNPQWYFPGLIDEVGIFNRALSEGEIQAIYQAGSAGKCKIVNQPPVVICQDIEVPVDGSCEANITAADVDGGSYDPDDDPITLSIDPPGPFIVGEHYVTLTVTDDSEESDTCQAVVTVVDSIPPIPDVLELPTVTGECFAEITSTPTATDNCAGTISGTTSDLLIYGEQGTHTVTWTYDDGNGNAITQTQTVIVQDVTPPLLSVTVSPNILWPPNHKMVLITPTIVASDNCDPAPDVRLSSIIMNEGEETNTYDPTYDSWEGDGHTFDDIQFDEDGNIYLRAERSGRGDGRVYQITYTATDDAGNTFTVSATVTVPHNQ